MLTPTVLASMVESVWCPGTVSRRMKLADVLWINSGQHGMRVWLPLFPQNDKVHNFMSKRIMLPFQCSIYPLGEEGGGGWRWVVFGMWVNDWWNV